MASTSINMHIPMVRPARTPFISGYWQNKVSAGRCHGDVAMRCAAEESSSSSTATATATAKAKKGPAGPVKPLPQMMEEDVIPSLKATLEAEEALSQIQLSFQDNRLSGWFVKENVPYYFWAFFPDGNLTGPKGFSLSSHGSGASTIEPFLIDERKVTAALMVFWVEKRLAAQGILPVWKH